MRDHAQTESGARVRDARAALALIGEAQRLALAIEIARDACEPSSALSLGLLAEVAGLTRGDLTRRAYVARVAAGERS